MSVPGFRSYKDDDKSLLLSTDMDMTASVENVPKDHPFSMKLIEIISQVELRENSPSSLAKKWTKLASKVTSKYEEQKRASTSAKERFRWSDGDIIQMKAVAETAPEHERWKYHFYCARQFVLMNLPNTALTELEKIPASKTTKECIFIRAIAYELNRQFHLAYKDYRVLVESKSRDTLRIFSKQRHLYIYKIVIAKNVMRTTSEDVDLVDEFDIDRGYGLYSEIGKNSD